MPIDLKELMSQATVGLGKPKRPKHGMRHTHVEHLNDGSHVARMQPHEGEEINFSAQDHNELAKKIKQYLGEAAEPEAPQKNDAPAEEMAEKA